MSDSEFRPWRVEHVDLSGAVSATVSDPSAGAFIVIWSDGTPLGQLVFPPETQPPDPVELNQRIARAIAPAVGRHLFAPSFAGPLPARRGPPAHPPATTDLNAVVACRSPIEALQRATGPNGAASSLDPEVSDPSISVIICTRNRPDSLRRCLAGVAELNVPPHETLVVDNDPASGEASKVVQAFENVRYVPEPRPGLSIARNAGVRAASGEILAFTDDDVRVHPAWTDRVGQVFADPAICAASGLVLPSELDTLAQLSFQLNGEEWGYRPVDFGDPFFQSMSNIGVPVWRIGAGANMAFRRSVFDEVGLFDERLGAGAAGCSEDSEIWYRILAAGKRIRYEPRAVVFHSHRREAAALRDQMYAYMKGHVSALLFQHQRHGHRGNLFRTFVEIPVYYARKVTGRLFKGRDPLALPLIPQMAGGIAGLFHYLKHRREPPWSEPSAGVRVRR